MQWTIDDILKATGGRFLYGDTGLTFEGVGIDSRTIAAGQLFVAICGEKHDGHSFIDQVAAQGVRGVLAGAQVADALHQRWREKGLACIAVDDTTRALGALAAWQRRRADIPVVAITGSNGKTSTRQMTTQVLGRRFNTLATTGNFNNEIGLPLTLFKLDGQHQAAVLELGMNHPGELTRLGAICRPTIGVVTNVGPGHLEFLGSLDGVARAKEELIACIDRAGTAVLNADDPRVSAMAQRAGRAVLFFGGSLRADIRAADIREAQGGVAFDLMLPRSTATVLLPTPGRFMVANALAAAACGYLTGVGIDEIKAGLESFIPLKGRLKVIPTPAGVNIIDDTYNANPASMAAAIDTFKALRGNAPGLIILGDMLELGEQSPALHRQVGGLAAAALPLRLYAHGPHSADVAAGAAAVGISRAAIFTGSKEEIAADVIGRLAAGDWVLVKGSRGMAMETIVEALRNRKQN